MSLRFAAEEAALVSARDRALEWAAVAERALPGLPGLIDGAALTPAEDQALPFLTEYGAVSAFRLFDDQGRLIFSTKSALAGSPDQAGMVQMVQAHGLPKVARIGEAADVFLPLRRVDGQTAGTLAIRVDTVGLSPSVTQLFAVLLVVFPMLLALATAVALTSFSRQRKALLRHPERSEAVGKDPLTGVLDRTALLSRAETLFENRPDADYAIGVFFIDIDHFKSVNDNHGHAFGDRYLCHVADAIEGCLRQGDLVGRVGGDEFAVILPNANRPQVRAVAERIVAAAKRSFSFGASSIGGGVSVGCYLSRPGEALEQALRCADDAVYHAKQMGRSQVVEFYGTLANARTRRDLIQESLVLATRSGAFGVEYQPIAAADGGQIVGYRAGMCVSTPEGVPIDPDEFMPIAESSTLIRPLGLEMLRRACQIGRDWPVGTFLEVGLTPTHFVSGTLPGDVERILERTEFRAERLVLSVSETVMADCGDTVTEQLCELRALGINIALDGFGAGGAGFGDMWRNPIDRLKVDRMLAENFEYDPERFEPLIQAVVELGHKMDMTVTLDGIDRDPHLDLIKSVGCDTYQGAMAGSAMSAEETVERQEGAG